MHFPSPRALAMAAPAVARPRLAPVAHPASTSCLLALWDRRRGHGRAVAAVRAREQGAAPPDPAAFLRRPEVATVTSTEEEREADAGSSFDGPGEDEAPEEEGVRGRRKAPEREWVDWEDLILEDTVPLVGFVRMILHSGKYESGDRLCPEHEKAILERLLPYHPQYNEKIGCGIDYITVGLHPEFENSRCLFIVRKDGEQIDFSFWKCVKGLIRQKYPMYADSFILRHFRRRQDY
ncbi:Protein DCL, chloroplastic-like [Zea mays]|uniref:Protein DCL chloroplastic n=1 Tax=Zea mays TaxID=4577 RepID=B4FWQ8_MAIZE|nr:Protein DCL, chloroplastic-like [Zea mays]ACF86551.1 unknown [Zea mays]AQK56381.1 Protein DCL chloroplastic [Zea mays]|eukprot:NP_001141526.1 uncharacterized protein LOC100273638 [Zea mays]